MSHYSANYEWLFGAQSIINISNWALQTNRSFVRSLPFMRKFWIDSRPFSNEVLCCNNDDVIRFEKPWRNVTWEIEQSRIWSGHSMIKNPLIVCCGATNEYSLKSVVDSCNMQIQCSKHICWCFLGATEKKKKLVQNVSPLKPMGFLVSRWLR